LKLRLARAGPAVPGDEDRALSIVDLDEAGMEPIATVSHTTGLRPHPGRDPAERDPVLLDWQHAGSRFDPSASAVRASPAGLLGSGKMCVASVFRPDTPGIVEECRRHR